VPGSCFGATSRNRQSVDMTSNMCSSKQGSLSVPETSACVVFIITNALFASLRYFSVTHCLPFSLHLNNSLKLAKLHPILINSFINNSSALALDLTSTHKHTLKNAFNSRLNLFGLFSLGVPFVAIKNSAFRGSSFRYGGSDSIISIAIIPNDQMSTFGPYSFCFTTSGAIQ
jgi:hypothetical protein